MRRFTAGIRLVTALLATGLLLHEGVGPLTQSGLLAYAVFAGWVLWLEATERARVTGLWPYWIDVAWSCLAVAASGHALLVVTMVHPVILASIGYGVSHGVVLSLTAGAFAAWQLQDRMLPGMLALGLVPAAALLARPMNLLRRRLLLIDELEQQLDPRRGLEPICCELVTRLRDGTQSDAVVLVLPSARSAPAIVAGREESAFRARPEVHAELERLLRTMPDVPLSHVRRRWWHPAPRTRTVGGGLAPRADAAELARLAELLEVQCLHIVPLRRYAQRFGHFVVGYGGGRGSMQDLSALAGAAPELLRIVEQAALVDQLQDESASHERARIGRDLHDSAIQPYLGLKYAVECVALRIPPDNPARADIDGLAELVNAEVASLRELIASLRSGGERGDSALVPAVRRQARRFALLFGIDVLVESPEHLPTTRALAAALFHMVNEALNNVRRHTEARVVRLSMALEAQSVVLRVRDDAGTVRGRPHADFRPRSLTERARELGGTVQVSQPDGLNTELLIRIPA